MTLLWAAGLARDLFRKPVPTPDQVRGRLFRDHAYAVVILSISARSSLLSAQPAAFTLASICSGRVAPAMTLATVGRAASHEKAS